MSSAVVEFIEGFMKALNAALKIRKEIKETSKMARSRFMDSEIKISKHERVAGFKTVRRERERDGWIFYSYFFHGDTFYAFWRK